MGEKKNTISPYNPPIGVLNDISPNPIYREVGIWDNSAATNRDTARLARKSETLKYVTAFKAICLRVRAVTAKEDDNFVPGSWPSRTWNEPRGRKEKPQLLHVWARIPEIHACLTAPNIVDNGKIDPAEFSQDMWLIDQHDIFVAESTATPTPMPGEVIWVKFGNPSNNGDPIYLGPVMPDRVENFPRSTGPKASARASSKLQSDASTGDSQSGKSTSKVGESVISAPIDCTDPEVSELTNTQYLTGDISVSVHPSSKLGEGISGWSPQYRADHGLGNYKKNFPMFESYIWYLWRRQVEIGAYRGAKGDKAAWNYWTRPRLKALVYFLCKKYKGNQDLDSGDVSAEKLAKTVWGALYNEGRFLPIGIFGGHLRSRSGGTGRRDLRWRLTKGGPNGHGWRDSGYGMGQTPLTSWRVQQKRLPSIILWHHDQMVDPYFGLSHQIVLFARRYGKCAKKSNVQYDVSPSYGSDKNRTFKISDQLLCVAIGMAGGGKGPSWGCPDCRHPFAKVEKGRAKNKARHFVQHGWKLFTDDDKASNLKEGDKIKTLNWYQEHYGPDGTKILATIAERPVLKSRTWCNDWEQGQKPPNTSKQTGGQQTASDTDSTGASTAKPKEKINDNQIPKPKTTPRPAAEGQITVVILGDSHMVASSTHGYQAQTLAQNYRNKGYNVVWDGDTAAGTFCKGGKGVDYFLGVLGALKSAKPDIIIVGAIGGNDVLKASKSTEKMAEYKEKYTKFFRKLKEISKASKVNLPNGVMKVIVNSMPPASVPPKTKKYADQRLKLNEKIASAANQVDIQYNDMMPDWPCFSVCTKDGVHYGGSEMGTQRDNLFYKHLLKQSGMNLPNAKQADQAALGPTTIGECGLTAGA